MGVRRMQTFLEQFCPEACYEVSIEEIANQYRQEHHENPVIVVDGSSGFNKLYGDLDWVCGGQFKEFADVVENFIYQFESLGIKLIFFYDGATQEGKRSVWVKRRLTTMDKAHAVIDSLNSGREIRRIQPENFVMPPGTGTVMSSVSSQRCIVQRSIIECDEEISNYAERNKCLAILAQDSDYVIYQHGAEYYLSFLHLDLTTMKTLAYDKVALARSLGLHLRDLPVLATLMGNDVISADDLKPFHNRLLGKGYHKEYTSVLVRAIASYVQRLPKGEDSLPCLQKLSVDVFGSAKRTEDLHRSILCYGKNMKENIRESDSRCAKWDEIMSVAYSNYISMAAPSFIYNILRKLPFEMSTALEDFRTKEPPSAVVLRLMRQRIYGVALREYPEKSGNSLIVEEWCMSGRQSMKSAMKVAAILPPEGIPGLLDLWSKNSDNLKEAKFKLLGWIASTHLSTITLSAFPECIIAAICILSYLYHEARILDDWEVRIFAAVVVEVQAMESKDLSMIKVKKVSVRGVQLATLFTRAITHFQLANSISGSPVHEWTKHYQIFDGKLFQKFYRDAVSVLASPRKGKLQHFNQICEVVLTSNKDA